MQGREERRCSNGGNAMLSKPYRKRDLALRFEISWEDAEEAPASGGGQ